MILIDTSAWIEFFRGRDPMARRVDAAIADDDAALCGPIMTELRRGLRTRKDRDRVLPLLSGCHWLEQPTNLWTDAGELGAAVARYGANVKTLDLLIASYALTHSIPIMAADSDFATLRKAGAGLLLVE